MRSSKTQAHPSWLDMIKECIVTLTGLPCRGVSRPQIKKYVTETYNLEFGADQNAQLSKAIVSGRREGIFVLPQGYQGRVDLAPKLRPRNALKLPLSELTFSKEPGAFNLSTSSEFVSLLENIRNHVLRSKSTRAVYVAMAKEFYSRTTTDVKALCSEPTDDDFLSYVRSNWPKVKSCLNLDSKVEEGTLTWGCVHKQESRKTNTICILSKLAEAVERADVLTNRPLCHLILTAVVFHELAHAFHKFFFYDNDTPSGLGIDEGRKCGESGWWVEEKIMGGYLRVEWKKKTQFGDMLSIKDVVLVKGDKSFKISTNAAKKMLSSLKNTKFTQLAEEKMKKHISPRGSVLARVTQPTKRPSTVRTVSVESCTESGIRFGSFVGQDKKDLVYDGYNY